MNGQSVKHLKQRIKVASRMAFSQYVKSREIKGNTDCMLWECCSQTYHEQRDFHRHVNIQHKAEVDALCEAIMTTGHPNARWSALRISHNSEPDDLHIDPQFVMAFGDNDVFSWLPQVSQDFSDNLSTENVLLFYKYRHLPSVQHVEQWQLCLCQRLGLTGKIRVGTEGLNGTVAGDIHATQLYVDSVCNHPWFSDMKDEDFKRSDGKRTVFPEGLKVGMFSEIVPMGIPPEDCCHAGAGEHLSVEEFHNEVSRYLTDEKRRKKAIFVDCRNFYESKIGKFEGAVAPSIRKFSYWPEYIEQNLDLFNDKDVYMYCTGGIRCERGSAYLKSKGICQQVYQLTGGIHKYIERYPEGYFRGKLFVFDDRYAIKANEDILSECTYCKQPFDQYQPCSSHHCHQLVLSCDACRHQGLTACCLLCQQHHQEGVGREECDCTKHRPRIPMEQPS